MTDVNIAVTILTDALQNKYDTIILISGDSDLTPPLRALKQFYPNKKAIVAFPPNRTSFELKNIANASFTIGRKKLSMSQLDEKIPTSSEHIITKPTEW